MILLVFVGGQGADCYLGLINSGVSTFFLIGFTISLCLIWLDVML